MREQSKRTLENNPLREVLRSSFMNIFREINSGFIERGESFIAVVTHKKGPVEALSPPWLFVTNLL